MTTPRDDHNRYDELAAGYALHALEPDEELEFTTHLATCETCQGGLGDHEFVAAQLGALADAEEAHAPDWQRIRAGVLGAATSEPAAPPISLDARRASRRPPRLLAAAAAAVAIAGVGVIGWQSLSGGGSDSVTSAIAACQHRAGCAVVRLHADKGAEPAVVLVNGTNVRLLPEKMSAPASGREYVLWQLPRTSSPTAIGEFTNASAPMSASLLAPYDATAGFAVSVEKAGVAHEAPSTVVAIGQTT